MAAGGLRPHGRRRQRWLPAALLLMVVLAHLGLGDAVWQMQSEWRAMTQQTVPPRLNVSFVHEMRQARRPAVRPMPPTPAIRRLNALPAELAATAPAQLTPLAPEMAVPLDALPDLPAVVAASDEDTEPGPEWPLSTRLSYVLSGNYRGPVSGHASVEWLRQGSHYQVRLEVAVGPRLAPLISRQMVSDGRLTPAGIAPQRFDEDTRILIAPRQRKTLLFERDSLSFADGRSERAPPGVQDSASQFVQLTWLFLTGRQQMRPGLVVELPLALPRRQYLWGYRVLGEDLLQTPIGPLSAWHLQPTRAPGGGNLVADVWLAPSLQYLPVRLLIREDGANFVDLMLDSLPLQEAATVGPSTQEKSP